MTEAGVLQCHRCAKTTLFASSRTAVGSPGGALGIADQRGPDSTVKSRRKTAAVNNHGMK